MLAGAGCGERRRGRESRARCAVAETNRNRGVFANSARPSLISAPMSLLTKKQPADKAGLAWRSTVGAYRTDALARPRRISGGVFNLSPKSGLAVAWLYGLTLSPRTW